MTNSSSVQPLTVSFFRSVLKGKISVPGDKSISHRALMFSALAIGESHITGLLEGEDVMQTAQAMQAMGANPKRIAPGEWRVIGQGIGQLKEPQDVLNMGNSGTSARLLSGILSSHGFFSVMTGDGSLRKRPMARVTTPLSETGAKFLTREGGRLPMAIVGTAKAHPVGYRLPVASAQVKSAILLAGLNADGITWVEEPVATRDHTENMLRHFGVDVRIEDLVDGGKKISLKGPVTLKARNIRVPGDPSSATFMLVAAAMISGSEICIEGVGLNPLRTGAFEVLKWMGADLCIENEHVEGGEPIGDLVIKGSNLKGVDVPADCAPSMIDEYPILSVAAAYADGVTRFRGLEELRVKESDRFTSIVDMLRGNGVQVDIDGDDLIITGTRGNIPGGGVVATHMDHRLAMSASILGLVAQKGIKVDDIRFIRTSFPNYFPLMNQLGAKFDV
ncbi:3-phosphoshikimate 1-carboxyvinyltransferase [Commensalibacter oyaizuii]|uniref:3-phosphoshikimate 1-carboxyvinyltransferase n=1 Tax=Commensalibacter oyaizuii TaxID=3043873 RepID=A0ABT6PY70_9PROT|nr:3-phosphoshikimate 1-carboxyvinyltransferase [Commensalibacter sp. TBRC 16381]MDI2089810.1 3-phosphoshikimate 1-carboxyvinyltransferase [Commensalibacter sp. TBRC 16381]